MRFSPSIPSVVPYRAEAGSILVPVHQQLSYNVNNNRICTLCQLAIAPVCHLSITAGRRELPGRLPLVPELSVIYRVERAAVLGPGGGLFRRYVNISRLETPVRPSGRVGKW